MKIRQSNLVHHFTCPKKFELSMEHDLEQSEAMREGILFESYVFGKFKEDNEAELIGKKQKKTIDAIKASAEKVRPIFFDGVPFVKMSYKMGDDVLEGEADFIGVIDIDGEMVHCIADLKRTSDIEKIWNYKAKKSEYLQSIVYPFMHYKLTGELLPFVYVIVEEHEIPLIKFVRVNVELSDFQFIQEKIHEVTTSLYFEANTEACIQKFGRCPFLEYCEEGRDVVAFYNEIKFSELING